MRVVVQIAHGRFSVGDVIPEMPGGQARGLIARGLVREAAGEQKKPALTSPVDRSLRAGQMQLKRR